MANAYKNKVVFGGTTIMDISDTTATASDVASGKVFYAADGSQKTGTATIGSGSAVTVTDTADPHGGTVRTITAVSLAGDTVSADKLLSGYTAHDSAGNPITGTYIPSGGSISLQSKSVNPTESAQTITADSGYDGLSSVEVGAIPSQYIVPSGSQTLTSNGTYDVTALASVTVNVPSSGATVGTASVTNSSNTATSISFTGLSGEPIAFFVRVTTTIQSSGNTSYYYVAAIRYNGDDTNGTYMRIGSTRAIYNDTSHYSYTYSNGTLTVRSSASRTTAGGSFFNGTYELTYIY